MGPDGADADDSSIVARVRAGDREGFAVLVARYERMVFALATRMTGSRDEAQDVMQSSFLAAYRQIGDFRGDASFKTWLYGIALNECRMLHRKSGRTTPLDGVAEPAAPVTGAHALECVARRHACGEQPHGDG
jgi:RNA polymerase sigma-70 factor (ECF subfamily)